MAGGLKKELADNGVKLFTEDKKLQVTSPLEKKEENEWAINEIKDLQELSENLTQRVLELQNKIGG